jgi:hypothetical protein
LKDTRLAQHKMAGEFNRSNLHTDVSETRSMTFFLSYSFFFFPFQQLASDVENRDQTITSLREKLAGNNKIFFFHLEIA